MSNSGEIKLVKVTMEFDNGEVRQLKGEKAKEWIESMHAVCDLAYSNGEEFPKFDWDIIKPAK